MSDAPPPGLGISAPPAAPAVDQLGFLDLLYAVPVGDLAVRVSGAQLNRVSAPEWSALAVILAVIVLSWIGLHKDRAITTAEDRSGRIGDIRFASTGFVQLLLEVVIIGLYFAMGLALKLPATNRSAASLPSQSWLTAYLLFIYIAYLAWDVIDLRRAVRDNCYPWRRRATAGLLVTSSFLPAWAGLYLLARLSPPHAVTLVTLFNILVLALLYAYRVAQDQWGNTPEARTRTPAATRPAPSTTDAKLAGGTGADKAFRGVKGLGYFLRRG